MVTTTFSATKKISHLVNDNWKINTLKKTWRFWKIMKIIFLSTWVICRFQWLIFKGVNPTLGYVRNFGKWLVGIEPTYEPFTNFLTHPSTL